MSVNVREKRDKAIAALVANPSIKQAADACGVNERTLRRWLDDDVFSREVAEARQAVSKSIMAAVMSRAAKAAEVLDDVMSNAKTSPYARTQAAKALLDLSFKAIETSEILERIEQLEQAAKEVE